MTGSVFGMGPKEVVPFFTVAEEIVIESPAVRCNLSLAGSGFQAGADAMLFIWAELPSFY
jgi:hypothetical protein